MKKLIAFFGVFLGLLNIAFAADKVNVYYFCGRPRCVTCVKIENYTKNAVDSMKDNDVIYKTIDMDNTDNSAMVKKYGLYTKSVIVSKTINGKEKWKNLDKIWLKTSNENEFKKYIVTEIKKIKGKK